MRGVYAASSVFLACLNYQALIAKNLANASTPGYRAERLELRSFEELLLGLSGDSADAVGLGVSSRAAPVDLSQGPLKETDRPLDLAVEGQAFFTVQTPQGIRLTRDGTFGLSAARELVTSEGYLVLGTNGPIVLPEGEVTVTEAGNVLVGDRAVAQLALAVPTDEAAVEKVGGNLLAGLWRAATPEEGRVLQGYIEGSNVDLSDAVVQMMAVYRTYEAAQRVVLAQSQAMDAAANELGRV
ncbi:MAG: flagellar hook-basal body protein [Anaerolineae bacterium]|nr:flagellar hook-basal body protein [Anaerolineae bacterium]